MNPPKTLKILHLNFDLLFADPSSAEKAECFGWCDKVRQKIYLQADLRPRMLADVALHEVAHALFLACGWPNEMTEEQCCSMISGPLLLVLAENPEFKDWLFWLMTQQ